MPLTPQITLTCTPQDLSGERVGSVANPSKVIISLCNWGPYLPCIPGTSNIIKTGPQTYPFDDTEDILTITLWGNDVISPANTFYEITLVDDRGNVVQSGLYQFNGTLTIDLSDASQILPPPEQTYIGYIVVDGGSAPMLDLSTGNVFDITLTEDMTPEFLNIQKGVIYQFIIRQDATGGWTFTWPAAVQNPSLVNPAASSRSTSSYVADLYLELLPQVGWQ